MNNFKMRKKTLEKNFIFVIGIHIPALMYFRFKPNKTQEKKRKAYL